MMFQQQRLTIFVTQWQRVLFTYSDKTAVKPAKIVVLIDDDPNVLDAVENVLSGSGYHVVALPSCDNIFNVIDAHKPDLILLDLLLGDQDGRLICKAVKNNPKTSNIPVIIISGSPDIYNTINEDCANDVVEKPFIEETLLSRIERQLRH